MISYNTKSNVCQTSLDAYYSFTFEGKLGPSQLIVLEELRRIEPATNLEIARALLWDINLVTPRMNELVKKGLVVYNSVRPCAVSGRKAIAWKSVKI